MIRAASKLTLGAFLREYYVPAKLAGRSPKTLEAYQTAICCWNRFLPKVPIASIDTATMGRFQQFVLQSRGPATANCYCRHIMALLRYAADEDVALIGRPPKCRKLPEPKRPPLALTVEEFSTVLQTARAWPGKIAGYGAADWWSAILLTCWETGLRYSALLQLRSVDVLFDSGGLYCAAETQKDGEGMWFSRGLFISIT